MAFSGGEKNPCFVTFVTKVVSFKASLIKNKNIHFFSFFDLDLSVAVKKKVTTKS